MSIRSLAALLTASIFVHGSHIEPVTSSISATSTLLPPPPPPTQATLGHSAAVAVEVITTHPKPLLWQPLGAPDAAALWKSELRTLRNGVLTHEVAVTVN